MASTSDSLRRSMSISSPPEFFKAADTFVPRPYIPNMIPKSSSLHDRSVEALANAPPTMDPSEDEPGVLFIHPPFSSVPAAPAGLTYAVMASNPQWFLDAKDFLTSPPSSTNGIPYPSELEPPRGWCPSGKRKDKGPAASWPEGEEPRLRCTFCRRTYAGVNAKSMWRRHVFEKHKIPMLNRRSDRPLPRGRGASNKENKDSPALEAAAPEQEPAADTEQPPPADEQTEDASSRPHPLSQSTLPPISPPLTPGSPPLDPQPDTQVVPPSPYDPLLTPSFRHSPARLPSDQPWRFPSPSHPLHSRTREICLSMLAPTSSPATKRLFIFNASPNTQATPMQSPRTIYGDMRISELETPESLERLPRASPRSLFSQGRLPVPMLPDRSYHGRPKMTIEQSPLARSSRKSSQPVDWSAATSNSLLPENDPFAELYNHWSPAIPSRSDSPPLSTREGDSPVVRTAPRSEPGLGIGLLDPFTLGSKDDDRVSHSATPSPPHKKRRRNDDL